MRARIKDGVVIEILRSVDGFAIEQCFHPDILAGSVPCDGDTQIGWVLQEDGTLVPPEAPEAPEASEEPNP